MPDQRKSGTEESRTPTVDVQKEEAYWREQHARQAFAEKDRPFEDYAPAYRVGYEGVSKYAGKRYEEIENDLALDYEKARPGSAVPWDTVRPAVKAAWERMVGVIPAREPDRGVRGFI